MEGLRIVTTTLSLSSNLTERPSLSPNVWRRRVLIPCNARRGFNLTTTCALDKKNVNSFLEQDGNDTIAAADAPTSALHLPFQSASAAAADDKKKKKKDLPNGLNEDDISDADADADTVIQAHHTSKTKLTYNIVFVTSEAAPYSKTGGLGDVCGSLPIALAARGHRVMVVSPRYINGTPSDNNYSNAVDVECRINIPCFAALQQVAFFHEYRQGVDWVFVDHASYHRPGNPYGDSHGAYGDNQFRFTLLSHAACEAPLVIPLGGFTYGEKCLFLVNDWHAGLVPVLLAAKYRPYGVYKDARSILVIHNLAHQGVEPAATYKNLGLPDEWYGALEWVFPTWARTHALDTGEAVNILKGAIVTSDRILTVSQGYSWEITTVEGGYGLNDLLSSRKSVLNGITNGIDIVEWDPASDKHIPFHYSIEDLSGKVKCKTDLQKELGLPIKPDCPLIGFIGRLDYQKGIDLIRAAMPDLMQDDVQFVMLGSGDPQTEDWMRVTESAYKDKYRGWVGFNVPISHRITAGCDILLMPSRFEPCGLNQLYAMRYGTIPVVHCTGGLRDTVETFNPYIQEGTGQGTGWTFSPLSKESMLAALRVAIGTYRDHKSSWEGLMKRGMESDYTWDKAASQYEQDRKLLTCATHSSNYNAWKLSMENARFIERVNDFDLESIGRYLHIVDRALLSALVEKWQSETCTFHFRLDEMTITLDDVNQILGVPIYRDAVVAMDTTSHRAIDVETARKWVVEYLGMNAEEA